MEFIGLDTQYPCADGQTRRRIHLDGAASPLASKVAFDAMSAVLPHYSNSHSYVHNSAQISTHALAWAHDTVLDYLGADKQDYTAVFLGSGCTAAINRLARGLNTRCAQKPRVFVSAMEHHANDLAHRLDGNQVDYLDLSGEQAELGAIDLSAAAKKISESADQLNYIACSSISNVTGIANDWPRLAELAHQHGGYIIVDAAQSVAHQAVDLSSLPDAQQPDFWVFSAHKLYTPMGPGVLVAKRSAIFELSGQDLGGGSVSDVSLFDYQLLDTLPDREQSGTPNIVGAVALAAVMQSLKSAGLTTIEAQERALMGDLLERLKHLPGVTVYGDTELNRLGAVSFNLEGIPQSLLAAVLNDYYGIAVRNECFCAHPYVSELLKTELWELDLDGLSDDEVEQKVNQHRGMVRASISHYSSAADIDALCSALTDIAARIKESSSYDSKHYDPLADGSFKHKTFAIDWQQAVPALFD